jgi:hypothetical protein
MVQRTHIFNNTNLSISKLPTVSGNISSFITSKLSVYLLQLPSTIILRYGFLRSGKYELTCIHSMDSFWIHLCSSDLSLPCYHVVSKVLDVVITLLRDRLLFKTEILHCIPCGLGSKSYCLPVSHRKFFILFSQLKYIISHKLLTICSWKEGSVFCVAGTGIL